MAEFNTQGMIIGALLVGLFISIITGSIYLLNDNYDTSGYDNESINKYNQLTSLSQDLETIEEETDKITPSANAFDFFSDIWSKITGPFKFIYGSYRTVSYLADEGVNDLNLMPVFRVFFHSLLVVLVIVGIVIFKIYLGRNK
jgi:hypothetical protein